MSGEDSCARNGLKCSIFARICFQRMSLAKASTRERLQRRKADTDFGSLPRFQSHLRPSARLRLDTPAAAQRLVERNQVANDSGLALGQLLLG